MKPGSRCRTMASRLWALCVGGLVLGLASPCPAPCSCPADRSLSCRGCPADYLTVSSDTLSVTVSGCKDILYLLRLHRPLPPDRRVDKFSLRKLQITDSFIDKIPESYVNPEYAIQSLVMSNNSIEMIDVGLEAGNLTYLDLSRNRLSYLKNRTFERMNNIVFLDLGSNRIRDMSMLAFVGLNKLVHLDLSKNNLTFLMDAVFLPLISLQRLNVSSNKLEALSEKCFGSLLLLQQLDVSYNRLTSVAPGTLQFLPNLAKLLLADNPQLRPDAQIFVGTGRRLQQVDASRTGLRRVPEALTHSVRYLSLAGNRISTLRCGDLDGYPLLHMLDFADNIIEYVEDDALGRLEMISRLYLNRNKLRTVPKVLPDKLSYLSLDTNLIENLTTADFATLGGLKILLLSNNLISYIQENTFVQLISLEVLDVSNNPIKALTPNTFGGPASLKDLRIAFVDISPPARDISFPVPSPEGIESLHLQHSPGLTRELLADTAALAAMSRLQYLDMSYSNLTNIRSDLLHFLPQLKVLRLDGNKINCSEMNWLAEWMRENLRGEFRQVKCFSPPAYAGKSVVDLPTDNRSGNTYSRDNHNQTTDQIIQNHKISSQFNDSKVTEHLNVHTNAITSGINTSQDTVQNKPKMNSAELKTNIFVKSLKLNSSQVEFSKINQLDKNDHIKSLLDFQFDEQHPMNFKLPKTANTQDDMNSEKTLKYDKLQLTASARKASMFLNLDLTDEDAGAADGGGGLKKINTIISSKNFTEKMSDKNKLIEIFSQLSHKENNSLSANKWQKINPATQESVSLCMETGNFNGTENKTKCSQHPEIPAVLSENRENKNIKTGRFIYRKNGNDKPNINAKAKKFKYVSRPNDRYNTTVPNDGNSTGRSEAAIKTRQLANQTRLIESRDPSILEHAVHSHDTASAGITGRKMTTPEAKSEKYAIKIENTTASNVDEGIKEPENDIQNISNVNTNNKETDGRENVGSSTKKFEEHEEENVSEYQTSRFRAEASGSQSGLGLGALVGVCGAACAALAGACVARRRPRSRGRQGAPEMMEVQTITAVGELW